VTSPCEIAWAPSAQRDLARLPEKVATAVVEFAYGTLAESPHRVGGDLHFELEGHHSARRGDFRVIYRINDAERRVHIVAIGHRGDVYRQR
jgi:mRNA-degrading endonuclease RelE of RelBE toxin-antitoxin system